MKHSFRLNISFICEFFCRIRADRNPFPVYPDSGSPILTGRTNAKNAATAMFVRGCSILCIYIRRSFSQIRKSVVKTICVYMVNNFKRPSAFDVKEGKSMRFVWRAINIYLKTNVAAFASNLCSSNVATHGIPLPIDNPSKYSSFLVVVKKFAQAFCGKIGFSHDALLMLIGQRPLSVERTGAALLF